MEERQQQTDETYRRTVLDTLVDQAVRIEFAPNLIESELDVIIDEQDRYFRNMGLDLQSYLQYSGQEPNAYREGLRNVAERRIKQRLALLEAAKAENVHLHNEDLETEIEATAAGGRWRDHDRAGAFVERRLDGCGGHVLRIGAGPAEHEAQTIQSWLPTTISPLVPISINRVSVLRWCMPAPTTPDTISPPT